MRTYSISGRVCVVGSETPIEKVFVECGDDTGYTDRNGFYRMAVLLRSWSVRPTFKVTFSKAGFYSITKEIGITNWGNFDVRFNINMTRIPIPDPIPDPISNDKQIVVAAIVYDKASETVDVRIDDMNTIIEQMKKMIDPEAIDFAKTVVDGENFLPDEE